MSPGNNCGSQDNCSATRQVLNRVGEKWSVLIVAMLGNGRQRFSELRRSIDGISQRMLTLTLRGLERDGIVIRTVHPTVPPTVDYELTELGFTLLEPIGALTRWAQDNRTKFQAARNRFDATVDKRGADDLPESGERPVAKSASGARPHDSPFERAASTAVPASKIKAKARVRSRA